MSLLAPIALLAIILIGQLLFLLAPARRAVIALFLFGSLFLPVTSLDLPFVPTLDKRVASSLAALFGVLVHDRQSITRARFRKTDIPMAVWCVTPFFSSTTNGLGVHDGIANVLRHVLAWGVPYWLGRIYVRDLGALRELAIAVMIASLAYALLCAWELRMSPRLHKIVYGIHQHEVRQTRRGDGYRPMVFMEHGLMLGLWMASASLTATWLWLRRSWNGVFGLPAPYWAIALVITTLLCKSFGAILLLGAGLLTLAFTTATRSRLALVVLLLTPSLYVTCRMTEHFDGGRAVEIARVWSEERAESLQTRLASEELLVSRALERAPLGWGGWNRSAIIDPISGRYEAVPDGLWIIALGRHGVIGLVSLLLVFCLPIVLALRAVPTSLWGHPMFAPATALTVIVGLSMIDHLMNAMVNPIYMLIAGGLSSALRRSRLRAQWEESVYSKPLARGTT